MPFTNTTLLYNNTTSITDFIQRTSTMTNVGGLEMLGVFSMIMIFFVSFISMWRYQKSAALTVSSFISTVASVLLIAMGLLPVWFVIVFVLLFVASLAFKDF